MEQHYRIEMNRLRYVYVEAVYLLTARESKNAQS